MKFLKKLPLIICLGALFALWLWFIYWATKKGNFSWPVGATVAGAFISTPLIVKKLIEKLRKAKDAGKTEFGEVQRKMRILAEVFAVAALFLGSSALIQIALSAEQQNVSENLKRIANAMSISSKVLDDAKCKQLPWTQSACDQVKTDLDQIFLGTMNYSLSEHSANTLTKSIENTYNRLITAQGSGFDKADIRSLMDLLNSVTHDPVSDTFNKMYLGMFTFLFAFLAGTRKIAIAWVGA